MNARVPPHDLDAEAAVLGAMLLSPEAFDVASAALKPEHFYSPGHGLIFSASLALALRGQPVDMITLCAELLRQERLMAVGGAAKVSSLVDGQPSWHNVEAHCAIVRDRWLRRRLLDCAAELAAIEQEAESAAAAVDRAETILQSLALDADRGAAAAMPEVMTEGLQSVDAAARAGGLSGVTTGLEGLNEVLGGLQRSDLVIVAGRPGMGKSSLAMGMLVAAARAGDPGICFSLEMSRVQLAQRLLAREASVSLQDLRFGRLPAEDYARVAYAAGVVNDLPLWIDATPALSIMDLRARARRARREHGIKLVVVDYLQLARASTKQDSREREIAEVSTGLKNLAKEMDVPVVAVSQLSRKCEERADKRPVLSDLRDSGQIEQDADTVLFVYRDEKYYPNKVEARGMAEIIVGKQRQGPPDTVHVGFQGDRCRFTDIGEAA